MLIWGTIRGKELALNWHYFGKALDHRFLTGVREDHKSKVMYPFTPVLQRFGGPQVVVIDTLGVLGTFYDF